MALTTQYNHLERLAGSARPGAAGRLRSAEQERCASQAVSRPPAIPKIHQGRASFMGSFALGALSSVLKIATAREGVRVMALMAEMITEAAMVRANWR